MNKTLIALLLSAGFLSSASATTIAIIDSGTDMKHRDIAPKAWINPIDIPGNNRDEDRNGYPDDIHGWNFAEGNNQVIDYKYLPLLNDDIKKFFAIQTKLLLGTHTAEELAWARTMVADQEFLKRINTYGNFMHGTHVAGISVKDAKDSKVMAVKLIPTEVNLPFSHLPAADIGEKSLRLTILKKGLEFLATQQMQMMTEIAAYVDGHNIPIANGSFGTGYAQASAIVEMLFKNLLRKDPTPEELKEASIHFLNALIKEGEKMVGAAPNTLFVFAAGNDGTNNDELPSSPTNINARNVISVGATIGYGVIAPFSNFGVKTVDVLAPGVAILASVPGDEYLSVSGTSQAAPYVANIAAKVKTANPNLTPEEIKEIILGTVDVRAELRDIVRTSGIVNADRAVIAGVLSTTLTLEQSISNARDTVRDVEVVESKNFRAPAIFPGLVRPLPTGFSF
jgi:cell wall-associated protease